MDIETIARFGKDSGIHGFMNTTWGWPSMESLHFLALAVLLGTVGLFDLRMLGFARGISLSALHRLVPFGAAAFCANIITGFMFFVSAPEQYAYNPAFQLKAACMAIAGVNMVIFYLTTSGRLQTLGPNADAPLLAKIIGGVSLAAWIGVVTFGRLITMFRPPNHWCFWC